VFLPFKKSALNSLGLALRSLGRDDEARAAYELGIAVDPRGFELLANLAGLQADKGHSSCRWPIIIFSLSIKHS